MTKNPSQLRIAPFFRQVNRAAIVDSARLEERIRGMYPLPQGPILVLAVDAPLVDLSAHFGITEMDGCAMLFFDVFTGGQYFCNVASAGDPEVFSAMKQWDDAGVMPIWLETRVGPCGLIRREFTLNEVYERAFVASARPNYIPQLQARFNAMLEPGVAESIVESRTGLAFAQVNIGFLGTSHSQPALPSAH